MSLRLITSSAIALTILFTSGCATGNLSYSIDPEINNLQTLANSVNLVAVSVIDSRSPTAEKLPDDSRSISGPQDEASTLKGKVIERLKQQKFKIINNALLADLAIEINIEQLEAVVTSSMLKSEIRVSTQLHLKANKQSQQMEKIFKMNRTQEVANPVVNADVSGVVNRVLSEQLSVIFADPELLELAKG